MEILRAPFQLINFLWRSPMQLMGWIWQNVWPTNGRPAKVKCINVKQHQSKRKETNKRKEQKIENLQLQLQADLDECNRRSAFQHRQLRADLDEYDRRLTFLYSHCGVLLPNTRVAVSFEKSHYNVKYDDVVTRLLQEVGLDTFPVHRGEIPGSGSDFDLIFHIASSPTQRLVNLDEHLRKRFDCSKSC